jgi:hypothetical protein
MGSNIAVPGCEAGGCVAVVCVAHSRIRCRRERGYAFVSPHKHGHCERVEKRSEKRIQKRAWPSRLIGMDGMQQSAGVNARWPIEMGGIRAEANRDL